MNKRILFLLVAIASFSSCENEAETTIPLSEVYIKLDLNFEDSDLNAFYAYKTFTQQRTAADRLGYGGIVVINGVSWDGSPVCLYAFDLACPVEVNRNVKVVPDDEGYCECPQCGTRYNIGNGTGRPVSDSKIFLRAYTVANNGNNTYIIR